MDLFSAISVLPLVSGSESKRLLFHRLLTPWPLLQPPGPAQKGSKHKINSEFEHSPLRSTGRPCFRPSVQEYCGDYQNSDYYVIERMLKL